MQTQNLADFQWKNRLVIVFDDQQDNSLYQEQIAVFNADRAGLKERKLLLFQISGGKISDQFSNHYSDELLMDIKNLKKDKSPFEVLLIGLDGGVKLRSTSLVPKK
ncbi:MAG: DUF4174 domain-containing protein, partial [Bacteroidota bacterium]